MNVITNLTPVEPNDAGAAVLPAPLLRLKLLGQMEGDDGLRQSILPRSRKTRAVLAVLALAAPQPVLRSRLTELLWSQRAREQGRASLRQSVHELQRALGPRAGVLLRADRNRLALLDNGLWVDVRMIVKATATDSAELEVFQPTLLDGLDGLDPAFDKWLVEQRQRVTQLVLSAAEAVLSTDDGPEVRIAAARRLLQIDSAHDGAWQALIDAHLARGERGAAMLALQRYSATLSSAGFDGLYGVQLKGTSFRATGDTVRLRVMPPRVLDTTPGDNPLPGLAEEVTAAVSRFRWISSFVEAMYDPTAGYLLDSTLQYSGNRLRIIARLLDLHAGNEVIWARRLDRPMDDLLLLQGEVAAELAAQIDPELLLREGERRNAIRATRRPLR